MTEPAPDNLLLFTPVPLTRRHARGWSSDVQIAFIQALSHFGMVSAAARSVGRTARSAYQLRARQGAESFAAAWDHALEFGLERMRHEAIARSLQPQRVPVTYQGRIIAWKEVHDDRLLLAALRAHYAFEDNRLLLHQWRIAEREAAREL